MSQPSSDKPKPARRRRARTRGGLTLAIALAIAAVAFTASRGYLAFVFKSTSSDIGWVYLPYVYEHHAARSEGRTLYRYHAEQFERRVADARAAGQAEPARESQWIEYPPLALMLIQTPKLFLNVAPNGEVPGYEDAFRKVLAAFDLFGFVLLLYFVPRLYPQERPAQHLERWLLYVVAGHVNGHLMYDRLTLVGGVLILAAVVFLTRPRLAAVGLLFFSLAVNYQISPLVLAPLFALGLVPARTVREDPRALVKPLLLRGLVVGAAILLVFLPIYLYEGPASLGLLHYHAERGLNTESVLSSVVLFFSFFGHEVAPVGAHQCWNLSSSATPFLVKLSAPLVLILVLGVVAGFWRAARRTLSAESRGPLAVAAGPAFVGFALAAFAASIVGSKVFSPQYIVWLVPLVPLMPGGRWTRWFFVLISAVTTVIYPWYFDEVSRGGPDPATMLGPTTAGKLLLILRNGLFIAFAIRLYLEARRTMNPGSTAGAGR
jgi:hypothetical protein